MKSKMSFFNTHIILEDFKRYWGIAVLYFFTLFFIGPLKLILTLNQPNNMIYREMERLLQFRHAEVQVTLFIAVPIILSILMFRYLQQNKSMTFIHGLPLTRSEIFHSHSIAGVTLLLLPILLNALILMVLAGTYNQGNVLIQEIFTVQTIISWLGWVVLTNVVVYFIANVVAMITGTSIVQGGLAFIFIFLPTGIATLMVMNFEQLIYGFTINKSGFEKVVMNMVPITAMMSADAVITLKMTIWYVILTVILYAIARYAYEKRDLESATDPIAFNILKPIFKYGVTFCAMVLLGAYLYGLKQMNAWLYTGYVLGGLFGYVVAEMIIQKTLWIFRNMKGLLLYAVVILLLFTGIKLDITGYERRVPALERIESVYYGNSFYRYWYENDETLRTKENIDLVTKLHSQLIENKEKFERVDVDAYRNKVAIVYKLKDGKTIAREYVVPEDFYRTNKYIGAIYESKEFKVNNNDVFDVDIAKINYMQIRSSFHSVQKSIKIFEMDEILEAIEKAQEDILEETSEASLSPNKPWGNITLYYEREDDLKNRIKTVYIPWKKSYNHIPKWLKEKGYYEKVKIMAEDVDYMVIQELSDDLKQSDYFSSVEIERALEQNTNKKMTLKEDNQIEEVLTYYEDGPPKDKEYIVGVYYKNGNNAIGWLDEKNTPRFVKDALK